MSPEIIIGPHKLFIQSQNKAASYEVIGKLWGGKLWGDLLYNVTLSMLCGIRKLSQIWTYILIIIPEFLPKLCKCHRNERFMSNIKK